MDSVSAMQRLNDRINRNTDLYAGEELNKLIVKLSEAEEANETLKLENNLFQNKLKDERALKESAEALIESKDNEISCLREEVAALKEKIEKQIKDPPTSYAERKRRALREYKEKFDRNIQHELELEMADVVEDNEMLHRRIDEQLNEICGSFCEEEVDGLTLSNNSVTSTTS
ncbi:DgyrCDS6947 [Dimorphilus gyrociliatus]|uniref:DgyrCDS6947 n=1 Tax=Dimorphilus gyrociliatus TaxID=2664684 RepID=A0A7I8VPI5_9ANNE|nr:DgyrCDS6947 [Dimorphilus gyrociliatus]